MPWKPAEPDEVPTLGYEVGEWIEEHCVIPDQEHGGEPYLLTEEMWTFLAHHYRLKPDAREGQLSTAFHYRRSLLVRPQKWGKGPLTAAVICAEAIGPTVFAGWDAEGRPLAKPRATPRIQVTASTEDQTGNVYNHLLPMIQRGPLIDLIPDAGQTRINLPFGGNIEPVTARRARGWVRRSRSRFRMRRGRGLARTVGSSSRTLNAVACRAWVVGVSRRRTRGIRLSSRWPRWLTSRAKSDIYRDFPQCPASWSYANKAERRKIHRFGLRQFVVGRPGRDRG